MQNEKEKLQISRDFSEITLAVSLLAGIWIIFWKIKDYFDNNMLQSGYIQYIIYFVVFFLLIEFLIIFVFLMLKGHMVSTKTGKGKLRNLAQMLLTYSFQFSILFSILLVLAIFFDSIFKGLSVNPVYTYLISALSAVISVVILLIVISISLYLNNSNFKDFFEKINALGEKSPWRSFFVIIFIFFMVVLITKLLVIPSYFLAGTFSIEVFPQPNTNGDILTFTIKETGLTSGISFISLDKLNANNNSREYIDNITMPIENKSMHKIMFGIFQKPNYYLNVNISNLSSGNYMLHAEVTFDATKNSTLGTIIKNGDRLFYIKARNANYSS